MHVTQDLNSFGEIIAHAQCSVDEKKYIYIPCVPHKNNCTQKNWFTLHGTERLTFGCFVPMIADHDLVKKSFGPMIADHDLVKKR
jgi:hypothetical protein